MACVAGETLNISFSKTEIADNIQLASMQNHVLLRFRSHTTKNTWRKHSFLIFTRPHAVHPQESDTVKRLLFPPWVGGLSFLYIQWMVLVLRDVGVLQSCGMGPVPHFPFQHIWFSSVVFSLI